MTSPSSTPAAPAPQAHTTASAHSSAAHHGPEPYSMEWWLHSNVFNITLVAVLLMVVVRKTGLHTIFNTQRESVANDLQTLFAARDAAQAQLKAIETRTAHVQQEVDAILAQAKTAAEDMAKGIVADAQREAEAIVVRTQAQMAQEERRLLTQLQQQLLEESVLAAKDALGKLTPTSLEGSVVAFAQAVKETPSPVLDSQRSPSGVA
ncbi:MAG: ATP synthase F0 subunit B [Vampirovibrionales bacterium]